jgi:hypothetical protein
MNGGGRGNIRADGEIEGIGLVWIGLCRPCENECGATPHKKAVLHPFNSPSLSFCGQFPPPPIITLCPLFPLTQSSITKPPSVGRLFFFFWPILPPIQLEEGGGEGDVPSGNHHLLAQEERGGGGGGGGGNCRFLVRPIPRLPHSLGPLPFFLARLQQKWARFIHTKKVAAASSHSTCQKRPF